MHTPVLFLALAIAAPPAQVPAVTYGKVLGLQNVQKIVVETLNNKVEAYNKGPRTPGTPEKLEYEPALSSVISERIVQAEVPPETTVTQATVMLKEGFGHFVDNLVEFAKKKLVGPVLTLNKQLYEQYMGRPLKEQKCGEVPCNRPPCCHYCEPPPCKKE
jgi:hypothetical protein